MKVYFDNAATTPIVDEVIQDITHVMKDIYGNPSSIHSMGREARTVIEKARKTIATGIQAAVGEIFFTSSASEANNTILRQCVCDHGVERIISSPIEHPCVLKTGIALEEAGKVELIHLDVDQEGRLSLEQLETLLQDQSKKTLVSLMYGNNEIGVINPIKEITALSKQYGALMHTDAVQLIGKFPIDVQDLGVDFLTGTAHKIHGPKGIGFMYINSKSIITPFITGGSQERNMRAGTENIYGIVGLASCFQLALDEMEVRKTKIRTVRDYLKAQLEANFPQVHFNGPQSGEFLYHLLSTSFPKTPKNLMMIYNLDIHQICASAGSACSSGSNKGSHVLAAIHGDAEYTTIRFSFSHLNTKEEVDFVIEKLKLIDP